MNPLRSLVRALIGASSGDDGEQNPEASAVLGYPANEIEADAWKTILMRNQIPSAIIGPARLPVYGMIDRQIRVEVLYGHLAEARELLGLDDDGVPLGEPAED